MKKQNVLFALFIIALIIYSTNLFAQNKATFNINQGDNLELIIQNGDIDIYTWDKNQLLITGEDDENNNNQIKVKRDGNNVKVIFQNSYSDDIKIQLPSQVNLEIKLQSGDLNIHNNIDGRVTIMSGGGDLEMKDAESDVKLITGGGDIITGNINGKCEITSAGGDIKIGKIKSTASINTSGGNVETGSIGGETKIATAGGNIETLNISGSAKISTSGGNINLGTVNGELKTSTGGGNIYVPGINGIAKVSTGGGNIDLGKVVGGISVSSGNGNIYADLSGNKVTQESKLATGTGNIGLDVSRSDKLTIIVNLGFNGVITKKEIQRRVKSNLEPLTEDIDGENGNVKLVYKLNGGGTEIKIATGNGTISLMAK